MRRGRPLAFRPAILRAAVMLALALGCAGCNLLANEFTWIDRAAPSTERAPDAPLSATLDHP